MVSFDGTSSVRRGRYRKPTEKSTTTSTASPSSSSAGDSSLELKTAGKVPVYQVRGRSRNHKQDTETDKNVSESTTVKANGESGFRVTRRKSYQSNKQRTNARNENQSAEVITNSKEAVSSTQHATQTISSRKYQSSNSESELKPSTDLAANHQPDNHRKTYVDVSTRKSPTGRRYRIRTVEANSINANGPTSQSQKKVTASTTPADDAKSTKKPSKKPEQRETPIDDEQNYPEHFKALLKSKKSTASPSTASASSRINSLTPKKLSTTVAPTETTTTLRPAYRHKKIERPNLKLLFPSLHTSTTTTEAAPSVTAIETDQTATDELSTETNAESSPDVSSTTPKIKTTVNKQTGGLKFSSKIRTENEDPTVALSGFRSRSTPLVFDTLKSSTQRPTSQFDTPSNHRFSTVSCSQEV